MSQRVLLTNAHDLVALTLRRLDHLDDTLHTKSCAGEITQRFAEDLQYLLRIDKANLEESLTQIRSVAAGVLS